MVKLGVFWDRSSLRAARVCWGLLCLSSAVLLHAGKEDGVQDDPGGGAASAGVLAQRAAREATREAGEDAQHATPAAAAEDVMLIDGEADSPFGWLPPELLRHIFSFIPERDDDRSRLSLGARLAPEPYYRVCRRWAAVIDDMVAWPTLPALSTSFRFLNLASDPERALRGWSVVDLDTCLQTIDALPPSAQERFPGLMAWRQGLQVHVLLEPSLRHAHDITHFWWTLGACRAVRPHLTCATLLSTNKSQISSTGTDLVREVAQLPDTCTVRHAYCTGYGEGAPPKAREQAGQIHLADEHLLRNWGQDVRAPLDELHLTLSKIPPSLWQQRAGDAGGIMHALPGLAVNVTLVANGDHVAMNAAAEPPEVKQGWQGVTLSRCSAAHIPAFAVVPGMVELDSILELLEVQGFACNQLYLSWVPAITALRHCPNLAALYVSQCPQLDTIENVPHVMSLELHDAPLVRALSPETFPLLTFLKLFNAPVTRLEGFILLRHVDITHDGDLAIENLPSLESLSLNGYPYLTEIRDCPRLRRLEVGPTDAIGVADPLVLRNIGPLEAVLRAAITADRDPESGDTYHILPAGTYSLDDAS